MWNGTITKFFREVHHEPMAEWIGAIPLSEWPQQHAVDDQLRPAMVTDMMWHGFGALALPIIRELEVSLRRPTISNCMLSVIMPGHDIKPHQDSFGEKWITRVHVPLITNWAATFRLGEDVYRMEPGCAYLVNISRTHSVENHGAIPRIHFMFDCYEP